MNQRTKFEQHAHDEQFKPRYHDKKYPYVVQAKVTAEQYAKVKDDTSNIIRKLIDTL